VCTKVHAGEPPLKNWFGDPYFQVRNGIAGCPVPRGPLATAAEMRQESHARTERGTTCWLQKKCTKPNAYRYDFDIAQAVRQRFEASTALKRASLWVTVQGRKVWVEGCVERAYRAGRIEALLQDVPDVEVVTVNVTSDPAGKVPYRTAPPGNAPDAQP
jgi:hypothetical protein